jgi:predicted signal transduction protein with EAL and GGDEF domain
MILPGDCELVASVSVGIALTEPGKTADDVLRDADVAMYDAKARGGGGIYRVFDPAAMGTRSRQRLQIEASARQFQDGGLLSQVAAALDAAGLPSQLLIVEITETTVMEDLSSAREVMKKLSRLGVRLASTTSAPAIPRWPT